jgi:hypothetical protein
MQIARICAAAILILHRTITAYIGPIISGIAGERT